MLNVREQETKDVLMHLNGENELLMQKTFECLLLNQLEIMKELNKINFPSLSSHVYTSTIPLGEGEIVVGEFNSKEK